jgi:hypothetical protein
MMRQVATSLAVEDNDPIASRDGLNIEEDRRVLWQA